MIKDKIIKAAISILAAILLVKWFPTNPGTALLTIAAIVIAAIYICEAIEMILKEGKS